jgi:hypothetical protein
MSEGTFHDKLLALKSVMALPLPNPIKADPDLTAFFENVGELAEVSYMLHTKLRIILCAPDTASVGAFTDVFRSTLSDLKPLFNRLLGPFGKRQEQVSDILKNPANAVFKQSVGNQVRESVRSSLQSVLIAPLQRMVSYQMMFERLLKVSQKGECSSNVIPDSLTAVQDDMKTFTQDADHASSSFEPLEALQIRFAEHRVYDYSRRVVIGEQVVDKESESFPYGWQERHFMLCNDVLFSWSLKRSFGRSGKLEIMSRADIASVTVSGKEVKVSFKPGTREDNLKFKLKDEATAQKWKSAME